MQVANDGSKPVTFRNQAGQILQATPITVVSGSNQPVAQTFPINGDSSICNISQLSNFQQQQPAITTHATQNSSQTVTTLRTSSSIDTTTMTTQQVTGITQIPANTSLLNGKLAIKIARLFFIVMHRL